MKYGKGVLVMPKLVFKTEQEMLQAFLSCKFLELEVETEYGEDEKCYLDELSFDIKE